MTITERVQKQFFAADLPTTNRPKLIRLPPTVVVKYNVEDRIARTKPAVVVEQPKAETKNRRTNLWSVEEHNRFLHGLELYPQGPWKCVAAVVGTKTTRQTMTHAQKYRQKIERHAKNEDIYPWMPLVGNATRSRWRPIDQQHHPRVPNIEDAIARWRPMTEPSFPRIPSINTVSNRWGSDEEERHR
jgi:SHAQKYF class myb-like DNA-binding protein